MNDGNTWKLLDDLSASTTLKYDKKDSEATDLRYNSMQTYHETSTVNCVDV